MLCTPALWRYLQDEVKSKGYSEDLIRENEWSQEISDCPQQHNGFDCGVFVCMLTDFMLADLVPLQCYSQHHMPYFRQKLCSDILRGYCVGRITSR